MKNKKYINFEIESVDVVDKEVDSQFAYAKILAFTSGENRNNLYCSLETLRNTAKSIENCPILYNFSNSLWGTWDVGTHTTPDKSLICGFIQPDSIEFKDLPDGRLGLFVMGRVWKKYSEKIMQIFSRNSTKKVSVEMEMSDSCEMINNPKITEMLDFEYFGVTILGDIIDEAVIGTNMEMISFSSENEEYKKAYQKEFSSKQKNYNSRYAEIDFTIPKEIKNNASKGLELAKTGKTSSGPVYMAIARHLIKSDNVSVDRVKFINKKIKSKIDFAEDTNEYLSFMLMGGKDAINWSKEISEKIDELDSKTITYFSENITFPYTSLTDINPALKGIIPPITLEQANHIAKVADASSWGIAISQFKKTHDIENGRWVENKNSSKNSEEIEITNFALEKDKWGTGNNVSVDKDKDSMSDSSWGDVDKSSLMEIVLKASNYKSLVDDVYALVKSEWENAPSQHLKYPIMQLSGGKFVYNRGALSAALGRAKGQNESSVINKVEGIYKKLGLGVEDNEKKEVKESMKNEIEEVEQKNMAGQTNGTQEMSVENVVENKEETFMAVVEEINEEKPVEKQEVESKVENKKFSLDSYLDVAAVMGFLVNQTENNKVIADKYATGDLEDEEFVKAMFTSMCNMSDDLKTFAAENASLKEENMSLKEFKAKVEKDNFTHQVESFMQEFEDKMPKEEFTKLKDDSANFNLENLDGWKNKVQAQAYVFSVSSKSKKQQKPGFTSIAFPFQMDDNKKSDNGSPWKC